MASSKENDDGNASSTESKVQERVEETQKLDTQNDIENKEEEETETEIEGEQSSQTPSKMTIVQVPEKKNKKKRKASLKTVQTPKKATQTPSKKKSSDGEEDEIETETKGEQSLHAETPNKKTVVEEEPEKQTINKRKVSQEPPIKATQTPTKKKPSDGEQQQEEEENETESPNKKIVVEEEPPKQTKNKRKVSQETPKKATQTPKPSDGEQEEEEEENETETPNKKIVVEEEAPKQTKNKRIVSQEAPKKATQTPTKKKPSDAHLSRSETLEEETMPGNDKTTAKPTDKKKKKKKGNDVHLSPPVSMSMPPPAPKENLDEDAGEKKGIINRVWSLDDEISVLKGMIKFQKKNGRGNNINHDDFYAFIVPKFVNGNYTKSQLRDKLRRLKKKFNNNINKDQFSNEHDCRTFKLSRKIWGDFSNLDSSLHAKTANKIVKRLKFSDSPDREEVDMMQVDEDMRENAGVAKSIDGENGLSAHYPYLVKALQTQCVSKEVLNDTFSLIDSSTLDEWNTEWKGIIRAETETYLRRLDLIKKQTVMVFDTMKLRS